jgi:hypothetical protein
MAAESRASVGTERSIEASLIEILVENKGIRDIELAIKGLYLAMSHSGSLTSLDLHNRADSLKNVADALKEVLPDAATTEHSTEIVELPN